MVGAVGFLADFGGTEILFQSGMDVQLARVLAMSLAILTTYVLHKKYTFDTSPGNGPVATQFALFYATQAFSAVLNYAVFFMLIRLLPEAWGIAGRFFSISSGVATGLLVNYFLLRAYVFSDGTANVITGRKFFQRLSVIFILLFAFLVLLPGVRETQSVLSSIEQHKSFGTQDPDIWLRMLKTRAWVTGAQGYYDHDVLKTNAPAGGIETPWTRPVDFLLAAGYALTPASLPVNTRLMLAAVWLPLLGGFVTLGLLCAAAMRLRHFYVPLAVVGFFLLTPLYTARFAPLDIDHHFLLSLLWCGVLYLLMSVPPARGRSLATGAVLGLMIWISLEAVMLAGLVYVLAGIYALKHPQARLDVFLLTLGVACVTALGLLLEQPLQTVMTYVAYDTLSIVHVFIFGLIATVMGVLSRLSWTGPQASTAMRMAVYAVASVLCAAISVFFFPLLLQGPFAQMHPYMADVFLPSIQEAQPIYQHGPIVLFYCLLALAGAVASLAAAWPQQPQQTARRYQIIVLSACLFLTAGMILLHARWVYYFFPVAIVAMAAFMPAVATQARYGVFSSLRVLPRLARFPAVLVIYGGMIAMATFMPAEATVNAKAAGFKCQRGPLQEMIHNGDLQKILGDDPLVVLTRQDLSSDVLFFTPYRVIAANYHREGQGMADLAAIQDATTEHDLQAKLQNRQVDALFYCPTVYNEGTALRRIGTGEVALPAWLEKLDIADDTSATDGAQQPVLLRVLR